MTFYCNFIAGSDGPGVRELKKAERKGRRIDWKKGLKGLKDDRLSGYVILLLTDSPEQLEIYSMREYAFRRLYQRDGLIVGSGKTVDACVDRIYELADQTYQKTGGLEIRKEILRAQEERKKLWQS